MSNGMKVLEITRGFMKSRIILTAAELDLFTRIEEEPATAETLAREFDLDQRALSRLLDALVTFGLLEKEIDRYVIGASGRFMSADHPETVLPMILHMNELWETWGRLTDTVKEGENLRRTPIPEKPHHLQEAFIGAMHVAGRGLSLEIADAYDLSGFRNFIDIGGGSGTYTIAFLRKNSYLRAALFDLPKVVRMAEARLESEGLLDRVTLYKGNFYNDDLPKGFDLALLSAIIHQNSREQNRMLFKKIHRSLTPGGVLLIRDHIMDDSRTYPPGGTIFALNMLVGTEGGDTYTFAEVNSDLESSGFKQIEQVRSGVKMDCLVEARKD